MLRSASLVFASLLGLSHALAACASDGEPIAAEDGGTADHDADHQQDDGDPGVDRDSGDDAEHADAGILTDADPQSDASWDAGIVDPNAAPALNGCSSYVDRTASAANRTLTWDFSVASDPARCIKVKVGQSVTLAGDLSEHPIDELGGTRPNPFADANDTKSTFTFANAGGFGFYCILHMEMNGTVWVVD